MATAADLIDLATGLLEDPANDVWGRTELLEYLNDGLKALAAKRPDEFVVTAVVTLAEGPKQSLPSDYVALLRPLSNIDNAETTRGRAIRLVPKELLDNASPGWMLAPQSTTREVALSPDQSSEFWVYPPAVAGAKLELEVERNPSVMTQGSAVPVNAKFHPALVDYVVFRALSKDSEYAVDGKAGAFYQSFMNHIGGPGEPQ